MARAISPVARASATSDSAPCTPPASTPSRQSSRKDKANYRKFLYRNYDEDFALGETLQGVVGGFLKTQSKHLRFVLVDFPDGRHTRVHVRSFDISGYGRMNPSNLRRGDTLTLRKTGYLTDRRITNWVVESCALSGLMRAPDGGRELEIDQRDHGDRPLIFFQNEIKDLSPERCYIKKK